MSAAAVVYEVNLDVDAGISDAYRVWLRAHITTLLALPGFVSARLFDVDDPVAEGRVDLCVQYRLRDAAALQAYLHDHAPRMRDEGMARFAGRFQATRRVLRPRP